MKFSWKDNVLDFLLIGCFNSSLSSLLCYLIIFILAYNGFQEYIDLIGDISMVYGWLIILAIFQLLFFFVCSKKLKILEKRLQGLEWITHKKQNLNEKEVKKE